MQVLPLKRAVFILAILSTDPTHTVRADPSSIAYQLLLNRNKPLLFDNAEHGQCGHGFWAAWDPINETGSTCASEELDWPGLVEVINQTAPVSPSGSKVYRFPTEVPSDWDGTSTEGIHTAKFSTSHPSLLAAQSGYSGAGGRVRYSAYYLIESGFDDFAGGAGTPWHIQMQWKAIQPSYPGQNPKIAWGFHNLDAGNGQWVRQIQLTVKNADNELCADSYDRYDRLGSVGLNPVAVPTNVWIKVTIEIAFDAQSGYIKIWQSDAFGDDQIVIDVQGIDTISQLIKPAPQPPDGLDECIAADGSRYYRTEPANFSFGVSNYLSTLSYLPGNRPYGSTEDHVLLIDDIVIERMSQ